MLKGTCIGISAIYVNENAQRLLGEWRSARGGGAKYGKWRLSLQRDQPFSNGVFRQLGDAVHLELLHHVAAVGLDGLDPQVQMIRNFLCAHALGDELQDLALAGRQHVAGHQCRLGDLAQVPFDDDIGDLGAQVGVAGGDVPDGMAELVEGAVLEQIT